MLFAALALILFFAEIHVFDVGFLHADLEAALQHRKPPPQSVSNSARFSLQKPGLNCSRASNSGNRSTSLPQQPWRSVDKSSLPDMTMYDIFIAIPAAGQERERRDAVRASWAKMLASPRCKRCQQSKLACRFVVGTEGNVTASRREAAEFGDLDVLEDFAQEETYTMRSQKTYRTIRHVVQNYNFKFILKCDTDSWVYVDRLLNLFDREALWGKERLYAGNFRDGAGANALTDPNAKWYDPVYPEAVGFTQYPHHAKGAGYILSRALAEFVGNMQTDFWVFVPSEDVAIGFWLMAVHKEIHDIPVQIQPACGNDTVVDHYITPEMMRRRWVRYDNDCEPCSGCSAIQWPFAALCLVVGCLHVVMHW